MSKLNSERKAFLRNEIRKRDEKIRKNEADVDRATDELEQKILATKSACFAAYEEQYVRTGEFRLIPDMCRGYMHTPNPDLIKRGRDNIMLFRIKDVLYPRIDFQIQANHFHFTDE